MIEKRQLLQQLYEVEDQEEVTDSDIIEGREDTVAGYHAKQIRPITQNDQ